MTTHFPTLGNELSFNELAAIAAGKEGEMFAGEYQNSGKKVGSMTISELMDFYKTQKLSYCISYGRDGYSVTSWDSTQLFPNKNTFFIPRI
jgi:hypothetical protein